MVKVRELKIEEEVVFRNWMNKSFYCSDKKQVLKTIYGNFFCFFSNET